MIGLPRATVVKDHVETARNCNYQLLKLFMCVPAAFGTSWNIIQVVYSLDIERNVAAVLYECEITSRVRYFRQLDESAIR